MFQWIALLSSLAQSGLNGMRINDPTMLYKASPPLNKHYAQVLNTDEKPPGQWWHKTF